MAVYKEKSMNKVTEYQDLEEYLADYYKTDSGKLHLALKEMCCFIYDKYFLPKFSTIEEDMEDSAAFLSSFLDRMNLTYDHFFRLIRDYSFGYGLDYIKEIGPLIDPKYKENDLEF